MTTPLLPKPQTPHFAFLDALRGLASLWVFVYHLYGWNQFNLALDRLPGWIKVIAFEWGQYAVMVFFVLSGFVMAHSLNKAIITPAYIVNFSLRRWLRLSPVYYGAIGVACLVSWWLASIGWQPSPILIREPQAPARAIAHLFYLQELLGFKSFDPIYWTLCLEMQFYLVLCVMLGVAQGLTQKFKIGWSKLAVFIPLTAAAILYASNKSTWPFWRPFCGYWIFSFLLGAWAYWAWQRQVPKAWFYVGVTLILVAKTINPAIALTTALTASLIFAVAEAQKLDQWLKHPIFQWLGRLSYSLYLFHSSAIDLGVNSYLLVFRPSSPTFAQHLIMLIWVMMLVSILSVAGWYLLERPAIAWSRALKRKPRPIVDSRLQTID
jgi:peptidoglycan/LPS O-acetylase OafA/YrhL